VKKIKWRIINIAFWLEIILSYVLPFKVVDNFQYKIGTPIPYFTVYNTGIGISPLMSTHLNPLGFIADVVIIYLVILLCVNIYQKIKLLHRK
jgi:lipoprotein signal peptidase